jgi:hypothetical protein
MNQSPFASRAFSNPTFPGSVAAMASNAAGEMAIRTMRPIWGRAAPNRESIRFRFSRWRVLKSGNCERLVRKLLRLALLRAVEEQE